LIHAYEKKEVKVTSPLRDAVNIMVTSSR